MDLWLHTFVIAHQSDILVTTVQRNCTIYLLHERMDKTGRHCLYAPGNIKVCSRFFWRVGAMKLIRYSIILAVGSVIAFSGCAVIDSIFDPLPDEYIQGVRLPKDFPDEYLEIYDDAVVFDADEYKGRMRISFGTEDDIGDIADFYEDAFEESNLLFEIVENDRDEFHANGKGLDFYFEIKAEKARGNYEERVFTSTADIKIEFLEIGEEILKSMQGFWHACGAEGIINDETRKVGFAMEFDGTAINVYSDFILISENQKFKFIDDNTIVFIQDENETTYQITFETRDGMQIMSILKNGETMNLEKSSYEAMLEYVPGKETLEKMQGFWNMCGIEGGIFYTSKTQGSAIEITNSNSTIYEKGQIIIENCDFKFIDDNTISYNVGNEEKTVFIEFETIFGQSVMSITEEQSTRHFEKSTHKEMQDYYIVTREELIERVQGFWHACGYGGEELSDSVRGEGGAVEVMDMRVNIYYDFSIIFPYAAFEFSDDDTIRILLTGDEIDISFNIVGGKEVLTLTMYGETRYFEKSSYNQMMEFRQDN